MAIATEELITADRRDDRPRAQQPRQGARGATTASPPPLAVAVAAAAAAAGAAAARSRRRPSSTSSSRRPATRRSTSSRWSARSPASASRRPRTWSRPPPATVKEGVSKDEAEADQEEVRGGRRHRRDQVERYACGRRPGRVAGEPPRRPARRRRRIAGVLGFVHGP